MRHRILSILCVGALACAPSDAGVRNEDPQTAEEIPSSVGAPGSAVTGPRVVFLGTSLTAGLGLARDEDTYVARVAQLADSAGIPMRAVNAGVSGDTSAGGLRRIDWVLSEPVDVLVVELGANDALRGQDPKATAANLGRIVEIARSRYPDVQVLLVPMEAPPNLGLSYTEAFRRLFTDVAEDTGVALAPFLLEGVAGVPELNQADGIHPTQEGHRRMARTLWPSLEPLLREWATRHPAPREER